MTQRRRQPTAAPSRITGGDRKPFWQLGIVGVLLVVGVSQPTMAQLVPDNTLGAEESVVNSQANVRGLPADLIQGGATRGANLFHSFLEFNVGEGQRVYFDNPVQIETILSRVTGNNLSEILGTLGVNGGADLFFLNPNGIIFGPNAQLDIAGSFVASTAESLIFGDGLEFSATNPAAPPLLTVSVTPGLQHNLNNVGATITNTGTLAAGQDLMLVAGNLDLQGQLGSGRDLTLQALDTVRVRDTSLVPFIVAAGGQLLVQGNESVDIFALNHPDSGLFSDGDMVLRSANTVGGDAHYSNGGNFRIEMLDGSLGGLSSPNDPVIRALGDVSFNTYVGASLHIIAGGKVEIPGMILILGADMVNGLLKSVTLSDGTTTIIDGQNQLTVDIRAGVNLDAVGSPPVTGEDLGMFFDPFPISPRDTISSPATRADIVIGSIVTLTNPINQGGGRVLLSNQYQPNADRPGGITVGFIGTLDNRGGGSVIIDSKEGITLNGSIFAFATDVEGIGGDVTLLAADDVSLTNGVLVDVASGDGGSIKISAQNLDLATGNTLNAGINSNLGLPDSQAGDIEINVTEKVNLIGGSILNQVAESATGDAGDIKITTGSLSVTNGVISGNTSGQGDASDITIFAQNTVDVKNDEIISVVGPNATGNGGNISITTGSLEVSNGGFLSVDTFGKGNAGTITIIAEDAVTFKGEASNGFVSSATSSVANGATGNAGNIEITSGSLSVTDGALLVANTFGQGNAGNIILTAEEGDINAGDLNAISLSAQGSAGNITLTSTEGDINAGDINAFSSLSSFFSTSSNTDASPDFDSGNGGDITLTATQGNINVEALNSFSDTGGENVGNGGDITLRTNGNLSNSVFVTLSSSGESGTVRLESPGDFSLDNVSVTTSRQLTVDTPIIDPASGRQAIMEIPLESGGVGQSGNLFITSQGNLTLNNSNILSDTNGIDPAGDVSLISRQGTITLDNTRIDSETSGGGVAGNISLQSPQNITITGSNSSILTGTESKGNAGNITFNTPILTLEQGVTVSATTFGEGDSGTITVNAPISVTLDTNSQLTVETSGEGQAGGINITTNTLNIGENAQLSATATATSTNTEGGGSINLNSSDLNISGQLGVFAETQSVAPAGNIILKPNNNNPNLNIQFTNDGFISASTTANGAGGNIEISAPQTIDIRGDGLIEAETSDSGSAGNINLISEQIILADGIEISASTTGNGNAGTINLDANQINISQGEINAFTNSVGNAGSIILSDGENNSNQVSLNNAQISTIIQSQGEATQPSNIEIKTDNFTLTNSNIITSTEGIGDAGNITVPNAQLITLNQSDIIASTSGMGDTGVIGLNASQAIALENNSQISSAVLENAQGNSQQIGLNTLNLMLQEGSIISAATAGEGNAGSIQTMNTQNLILDNSKISTAIVATGKATDPSNITLDIQQLNLSNNAQITASTAGRGDAGSIIIPNAQSINLNQSNIAASTSGSGNAGDINLTAQQVINLTNNSTIETAANPDATGDGGDINIQTSILSLINNSQINASSQGETSADAGSIDINADNIILNNNSRITATTSAGQGGSITASANSLVINNGSQISTTTSGNQDAGGITLLIDELITLSGNGSGLFANTALGSAGNGGSIFIDPNFFSIIDGATIAVDSLGTGAGGDIELLAQNLLLSQGTISAETTSGTGGNITLRIEEDLRLLNGSAISTSAGNEQQGGDGGNIEIEARFIFAFPDGNNDITANAFTGSGGNILIDAQGIFGIDFRQELTSGNDITASSEFGRAGVVRILQEIDPNQGLVTLPEQLGIPRPLEGCQSFGGQGSSSFVNAGRGGLRPNPYEPFSSSDILGDVRSPVQETQTVANGIMEAQGWTIAETGQVVLVTNIPATFSQLRCGLR